MVDHQYWVYHRSTFFMAKIFHVLLFWGVIYSHGSTATTKTNNYNNWIGYGVHCYVLLLGKMLGKCPVTCRMGQSGQSLVMMCKHLVTKGLDQRLDKVCIC